MLNGILDFHPIFSVLIGLFILFGISYVGRFFASFFEDKYFDLPSHHPIIGTLLISHLVFIFILFGIENNIIYIAIILLILGFIYFISFLPQIIFKQNKVNFYLSFLILVCFFLYSLSPLTNADSIDYHIGIPLYIIKYGYFPNDGTWLASRLFGYGEFMNLLGISGMTLTLGSLIQFASLVSIYQSIVSNIHSNSKNFNILIRISIVSLPVLIFLVGTSKFQLYPIALIVLSFNIYLNVCKNQIPLKNLFIVLLFCMSATLFKFNYLLPAFLISIFVLYRIFEDHRELFFSSLMLSIIMFAFVMLPFYFYKANLFDSSLIFSFLSPTVGKFVGSDNYELMLRDYNESNFFFPLSIIIPDSLGKISSVIGLGFILLFLINSHTSKKNKRIIMFLIVYLLGLLFLAQYTARSFLDFYFIVLMLIARTIKPNLHKVYIMNFIMFSQSIGVAILLIFGIFNSIGGIFSSSERLNVMKKQANGYEISRWADELITPGSSIIVTNRSMSFSKNKMIPGDWIEYVNWNTTEPLAYLEKPSLKLADYIFFIKIGNSYNIPDIFVNCFNEKDLVATKRFRLATRNPFNRVNQEVFLYNYDSTQIIKCLK